MEQGPRFVGPSEFPVHNPIYNDFPDFEGSNPWGVGSLQEMLRDTQGAPFQSEPSVIDSLTSLLQKLYQDASKKVGSIQMPSLEIEEPQWWADLKAADQARRNAGK